MQTLLVGGGAGFIGSNFVRWMLSRHPDLKIVNVDKLTYAGNLDNLSDLPTDRHIFVQADIADQERMNAIIEQYQPDKIVNFAAETHVDRSIHGGLRDFVLANTMGPQVLAEATKKFNIPLYIQISTDEVFGSLGLDEDRLFHEDTAFAPNMPYAACKAGGDLICRSYFQTFGTPIIVTHCSNNYGPYQYPEKFIPQTISKALADEQIPVYGDGLYVRDWIHVNDHCSAIELLLEKGVPGEVYNIGADNERSNLEVLKMILEILGKPETLISYVADRPGHDRRYGIDASKITAMGWKPEYPREKFEQGLREKIQWYADNKEWVEKLRTRGAQFNSHIKA
jgi:dTDP-glucose 4,6-dehydratase